MRIRSASCTWYRKVCSLITVMPRHRLIVNCSGIGFGIDPIARGVGVVFCRIQFFEPVILTGEVLGIYRDGTTKF